MGSDVTPLSCRELIQLRATMYAQIRRFFAQKNVLEVETPIFSQSGNTDPTIASIVANFSTDADKPDLRFAHTSPEFPMKRLLANGSGAIYQICKVFRKEECGRLHQPEFSMLEWYRPDLTYFQLMDEITLLLDELGIATEADRVSYSALFRQYLDLDILNAGLADLKVCAEQHDIAVVGFQDNFDDWAAMLLANLIEPHIGYKKPLFIYDYPASQAALAKIKIVNKPSESVAQRFELYINGVELANGYQELTDADECLFRFQQDNKKRKASGLPEIPIDKRLINSLVSGIPDSSGVALGLDRLLMLVSGEQEINSVLNFSFSQS